MRKEGKVKIRISLLKSGIFRFGIHETSCYQENFYNPEDRLEDPEGREDREEDPEENIETKKQAIKLIKLFKRENISFEIMTQMMHSGQKMHQKDAHRAQPTKKGKVSYK